VPDSEDSFAIGGSGYAVGLTNAEGLLGPSPQERSYSARQINSFSQPVFRDPNKEETQLDPRSGPLPLGWREFGSEDLHARSIKTPSSRRKGNEELINKVTGFMQWSQSE